MRAAGPGDDAAGAEEEGDAGLFLPAVGFGGFGFELGGGLEGVAGWREVGVGGVELDGGGLGTGQGAVAFFIEPGGDGLDGAGQESVAGGVGLGDGEAGL